MSAHLPGNQGAPQPFLNREAAGVADLPTAVHQEDHIELAVEVMEEESDENGSSSDEVEPDMRHSTMAYFIDIDPIHCRPRWKNYEVLHMDITTYANKDMHDLARVHIVDIHLKIYKWPTFDPSLHNNHRMSQKVQPFN